jgi:hypothetical protein
LLKRRSLTDIAFSENIEKLTPLASGVAPRG